MIQDVLLFLADKLDAYVKEKTMGTNSDAMVVMTNISDGNGIAIPENAIGVSLVNIEEERIFKEQRTKFLNQDGIYEKKNPELKLNLYVLICANHLDSDVSVSGKKNYYEGLKRLSHVISFFQAKNVFTKDKDDIPSEGIEKLVVELYSFSFEQMYNFWSVLGGNYLPSVLYKVRLLAIQASEGDGDLTPITEINIGANQR